MDSVLGRALAQVSTSAQWSTMDGVLAKVNRRLPPGQPPFSQRDLADLLSQVSEKELREHGIWVVSFGEGLQPIVVVNPAYARAARERRRGDKDECTCPGSAGGEDARSAAGRYFASSDYNAGRHSCARSSHRPNCLRWTPPSAGHLHSWRRGFDTAR